MSTKSALVSALIVSAAVFACAQEPIEPEAPASAPAEEAGAPATAPAEGAMELPADHPPIGDMSAGAAGSIPSLPQSAASLDGQVLTVAGVAFDVPSGWVRETPANSIRLAQYSLPGEAGPAELTVTAFGVGQGGDLQSNIDRWTGQFAGEGGAAPEAEIETREAGDRHVTTVAVRGTYQQSPMMGGGPPQPDSMLYGLIVEGGPQGTVFVKIVGPRATMEAHQASLMAFTESVRGVE